MRRVLRLLQIGRHGDALEAAVLGLLHLPLVQVQWLLGSRSLPRIDYARPRHNLLLGIIQTRVPWRRRQRWDGLLLGRV